MGLGGRTSSASRGGTLLTAVLAGALTAWCILRAPGGMEVALRASQLTARARAATPPLPSPYVALCLSAKDEWAELPEWVEHHLSIGVGKMYILDDGSQPPLSTVLGPYIASGAVEYQWFAGVPPPPPAGGDLEPEATADPQQLGAGAADPVPIELAAGFNYSGGERFQLYAYDWCLQQHRHDHTWMGFIDADEYMLLRPDIPSLPALLQRYEQYGGLAVFSKTFGTSGHKTRPAVGTRLGFTKCQPPRKRDYYKTIANLEYVLPTFGGRVGPHSFRMRDNAATVNSRAVAVQRDLSDHVVKDEIFLNHYSTRSAEEYAAKVGRGGGIHKRGRHNVTQLAWRDSLCTLECLDAVRHVQRAQGRLRLGLPSHSVSRQ